MKFSIRFENGIDPGRHAKSRQAKYQPAFLNQFSLMKAIGQFGGEITLHEQSNRETPTILVARRKGYSRGSFVAKISWNHACLTILSHRVARQCGTRGMLAWHRERHDPERPMLTVDLLSDSTLNCSRLMNSAFGGTTTARVARPSPPCRAPGSNMRTSAVCVARQFESGIATRQCRQRTKSPHRKATAPSPNFRYDEVRSL